MNSRFLYIVVAASLLVAACNEEPQEVVVPVSGITFNSPPAILLVGETLTLDAAVEPDEATNQTVTWHSDNEAVATVNPAGELTAVAPGTATITVSADDGKFMATCTVTVETEVIPVAGITLISSSAILLVGETLTLEAAIEPAEATNKIVTWSTNNDQVATINSTGELTAIAPGFATITATTDDGKFAATCMVTVTLAEAGIITMTTQASEVAFTISIPLGGDVIINWGDGKESNMNNANYTFVNYPPDGQLYLSFYYNYLHALEHSITITGHVVYLSCGSNQLTSLDVSNNPALTYLSCDNNQLTSLDVSYNTALTLLDCHGNLLTTIDVSSNTELISLYCYLNQITNLNVNHTLMYLSCGHNQLATLDVSGATALIALDCNDNQLTTLDVSGNTNLCHLRCYNNLLTTLNVSSDGKLAYLYCNHNQLTASALNNLFRNLNTSYELVIGPRYTPPFRISIIENPGTNDCDINIVEEKGWRVNR